MSSTKRRGGRRLKVVFASAIAAFAVGAVGVSTASADTIELDHGFLKISGLDDPTEVITPADPVQLTTQAALPGNFTVDNNPDVNDRQQIVTTTNGTGGTFTITVDTGVGPADTTAAIDFDATNAEINAALDDLDNLEYFDVRLSGGTLPNGDVTLEFVGAAVYGRPIDDIVVNDSVTGDYNQADVQEGLEPSDFDFPQFEGSLQGIPLGVDVTPAADVTGNFNAGTGVLTTDSVQYTALVALGPPLNATCNYSIPLTFSTADNSVFKGDLFDAATPPENGAMTAGWPSLPPQGGACALVDGFTSGNGALWLSNGVATPTLVPKPPQQQPTPPPTTKKCKKGFKKVKGKCKKAKKKKKKKKK